MFSHFKMACKIVDILTNILAEWVNYYTLCVCMCVFKHQL